MNSDEEFCISDNEVNVAAIGYEPTNGTGNFSSTLDGTGFSTVAGSNSATISPQLVSSTGTKTLSYYYTTPYGCNSDTVTNNVTINILPLVTFSLESNYNIDGGNIALNGSPADITYGEYSGNGILEGATQFNPSIEGIGQAIIKYQYKHPVTGCINSVTDTTLVRTSDNDTIQNLNASYCYDDTTIIITCNPTAYTAIIGDGFTSENGAINVLADDTAEYNIATAGKGTDVVRYNYLIDNTTYEIEFIVTIDSVGTVDFRETEPDSIAFCLIGEIEDFSAEHNPTASDGEGNFNEPNSTFFKNYGTLARLNLNDAIAGTYDLTYTYVSSTGACISSKTKKITVNELPEVNFTLNESYSSEAEEVILIGNKSEEYGAEYFSGKGTTVEGIFDPSSVDVQNNVAITYTFYDSTTNCENSVTNYTNIIEGTVSILYSDVDKFYCIYQEADTLTVDISDDDADSTTMRFVYKDSILAYDVMYSFDPAEFGNGRHTIYFFYEDTAGSSFNTNVILTVDDITSVDFIMNDKYCEDDDVTYEIASIVDHTFTGTHEFSSIYEGVIPSGNKFYFTPADVIVTGDSVEVEITYVYTSDSSACQNSITKSTMVFALPDVSFELRDTVNTTDPDEILIGSPPIGDLLDIFDGLGDTEVSTDGKFRISESPLGANIITYTYTDPYTTCTNIATDTTYILEATAEIKQLDIDEDITDYFCYDQGLIAFTSDTTSCNWAKNISFLVNDIEFDAGADVSFDPTSVTANVTHTITLRYFTETDNTKFEVDYTVEIDSLQQIIIKDDKLSFCEDGTAYLLESNYGESPNTIFTGDGITSSTNTYFFNPSSVYIGTYYLKATYTNSISECITEDSLPFVVHALPDVTFNILKNYYADEDSVLLDGGNKHPEGYYEAVDDLYQYAVGKQQYGDSLYTFIPDRIEEFDLGRDIYIRYTYEDTNHCINFAIDTTTVIDENGIVDSINFYTDANLITRQIYCYYNEPDTLYGYFKDIDGFDAVGNGYFTGYGILDTTTIDFAIYYADSAFNSASGDETGIRIDTITYHYIGENGVSWFEHDEIIKIDRIGDEYILVDNFDTTQCFHHDPEKMQTNFDHNSEDGTHEFSAVDPTNNCIDPTIGGGYNFNPHVDSAFVGLNQVLYTYDRDESGCKASKIYNVYMYNIEPGFDWDNECITNTITFTDTTITNDTIDLWNWNIDGLEDDDSIYFTQDLPYDFDYAENKTITLTIETRKGCFNSKTTDHFFGSDPVADFSWLNECFGKEIKFTNLTTHAAADTLKVFEWEFKDNSQTASVEDPVYTYSDTGSYDVKFTVTAKSGCSDDTIQTINIRPVIKFSELASDAFIYYQDFESGNQGWYPEKRDAFFSSWKLDIIDVNGLNDMISGNNSWWTGLIDDVSLEDERSWISSPCFIFDSLQKPMIKLNIWSDMLEVSNYDGAVLEYTEDYGENWNTIGSHDGYGLNWYNTNELDAVLPGGGDYGWSQKYDNWVSARYNLDLLKGKEDTIQFRIAYGSSGTHDDGFAFDDIWIGDRRRVALVEHFTNAHSNNITVDNEVNFIVNNNPIDIADIQYHLNSPGPDVMYEDNTADPVTRGFYYGIFSSPYTFIDGVLLLAEEEWDKTIKNAALTDPEFDIDLNVTYDGKFNVSAKMTALKATSHDVSLHIAVLENEINGADVGEDAGITFESVLKKMLPNAGGTNFTGSWPVASSQTITEEWVPENFYSTAESGANVIAFVQDEQTKEILQTASLFIDDSITGIFYVNANSGKYKMKLFPNPANEKAYLVFEDPVDTDCILQVYNHTGILIRNTSIAKGEKFLELTTENFAAGVYLIRIINNNELIAVRKLIISR